MHTVPDHQEVEPEEGKEEEGITTMASLEVAEHMASTEEEEPQEAISVAQTEPEEAEVHHIAGEAATNKKSALNIKLTKRQRSAMMALNH